MHAECANASYPTPTPKPFPSTCLLFSMLPICAITPHTLCSMSLRFIDRNLVSCFDSTHRVSSLPALETVERCLAESVLECHAVGLASSDARSKLLAKIPAIQEWCSTFLRDVPHDNAPLIDVSSSGKDRVCATKVVDIEEMVKSCKYGVTGQIDAVVEISGQAGVAPILAPLELKTGKKSYNVEHNTQVRSRSAPLPSSAYSSLLLSFLIPPPRFAPPLSPHKHLICAKTKNLLHFVGLPNMPPRALGGAPKAATLSSQNLTLVLDVQAVLYSMMMSDSEYGTKGGGPGLLVYLNENGNDTRGLPVKDGEAEYMMQVRKLDDLNSAEFKGDDQ